MVLSILINNNYYYWILVLINNFQNIPGKYHIFLLISECFKKNIKSLILWVVTKNINYNGLTNYDLYDYYASDIYIFYLAINLKILT